MFIVSKKFIKISSTFGLVLSSFFGANLAFAVVDTGLGATARQAQMDNIASSNLSVQAGTIIATVLGLIGVVFVILLIYAGLTYMISQGKKEEVDKALSTIKNSIIGLVIILGAYVVSNFVINAVFNESTSPATSPAASGTGPQQAPGFTGQQCPTPMVIDPNGNCVQLQTCSGSAPGFTCTCNGYTGNWVCP